MGVDDSASPGFTNLITLETAKPCRRRYGRSQPMLLNSFAGFLREAVRADGMINKPSIGARIIVLKRRTKNCT
jgi:hypothetical protein